MSTATNLTFILRDLSQQQATGRLLVKLPGALASIYLKVGDVVHATLGIKKGQEALSMILLATPESSEFRANLQAPETTIQGSLENLLRSVMSVPPRQASTAPPLGATPVPSSTTTSNPGLSNLRAANPRTNQPNADQTSFEPVNSGVTRSSETVSASFMSDLAKTLVEVMGPIGSIVLDDALADLNLPTLVPRADIPALLAEINKQLKSPSRQQPFSQKVNVLLVRYGLR
ncbi:MAG: DUF4388 domain-containing protein [Trueperaceae bacterium]